MRISLRNVTVIPMTGEEVITPGEVLVEDGVITFAGRAGSAPSPFEADEVIEGEHLVVTPGFVNSHTHAAMTLFRGYADDLPLMQWLNEKIWPAEARLKPEDVYWGTLLCCLEMIRSGTTTFADMYFHMDQAARAVEEAGLRASLSRGLIGVARGADRALGESRAFIKDWHRAAGGRITTLLGPHAPYTCPPDYLKKVMRLADELGVGIHIHVAETTSEIKEINEKYGCSPVALLHRTGLFAYPVLAAHCVHLNGDDMKLLAEKRVGVAHCPESNMKLASGVAPVARMLDAGITVGLGTDGAASNNNLDMVEETRTAALLQKVHTGDPTVIPAYQALAMATREGARALGLGEEIGTIEVGKRADLVVWERHAPHLCPAFNVFADLVYAARASDIHTVIADGRIVMRNREILTLDEEKVMAEAARRARRLAGK
ncbi:MAG: amidohydrolase [Desulfotomaculales bacterium]